MARHHFSSLFLYSFLNQPSCFICFLYVATASEFLSQHMHCDQQHRQARVWQFRIGWRDSFSGGSWLWFI